MENSFLLKKQEAKTLKERFPHLQERTLKEIVKVADQFGEFTRLCYEGRKPEAIFEELGVLGEKDKERAIIDIFQNYVNWCYSKENKTHSVRMYISRLKKVFYHHGITVNEFALKANLQYKKEEKDELHALTVEEIQKILLVARKDKISYYSALVSTGCRPSELLQVRMKDIDLSEVRPIIKIRAGNTKTKTGRSVFLTQEATEHLKKKISGLRSENDLVWGDPSYSKVWGNQQEEGRRFTFLTKRIGLDMKYESTGRNQITLYSFRSFFFNACANVHREGYAHRMTGHGGYLPQYDRMSTETKLDMFLSVEPHLTIDSKLRKDKMQEELKTENQELKKQLLLNKDMKKQLNEMKELKKNLAMKFLKNNTDYQEST